MSVSTALLVVAIFAQCLIILYALIRGATQYGRIETRLTHIESEMKTNGGSTLKDKLVKVNTQLDDHIAQHNGGW